jgi:serine/threonine protein kinase
MPLTPGTRLGPYEIVAPLGAGGMGEVYRAKDTRLGRSVALKVLPQHLSSNSEIRARFDREAKTISSLNHPHICTLHDVGRENGTDYLVMELVEGETLAQRLARGPIPLADVLSLGAQIADALDRAHRAGVIHRDLKPGNVMLTKSGAKLMDFGLARATGLGPTNDMSNSPTVAGPLTAEGSIIGTFQYMAPEQLEGHEADTRADVWALGCVLYEMATGKRAFEGKSQASLISAIMGSEPAPISQLSPLAPAALERLVGACLAKDPEDRVQSAHDVKLQLSWIAAGGSQAGTPPIAVAAPRPRPRLPRIGLAAVIAALLLGAGVGYVGRGQRSSATRQPWSNFTQLTDASGVETGPSISPDGTSFAYSSPAHGSWDIYVQRVGGRNPVLVAGDPNRDEMWPAFSPDGKLIAFNQGGGQGGIFIVGATGESVRRLTDFGANPAWSPDGQHIVFCTEEVASVYARNGTSTLWTVEVNGGAP